MSKVFIEMSLSLDGFAGKKDISVEHPFGIGGVRVYDWLFGKKTDEDERLIAESMACAGAVIGGARTYRVGIDGGWEGTNPFNCPFFVLSSSVPSRVPDGFTFVTDGIESALAKAKDTAGEKDVWIMGGPTVARQYLKAGLVDELRLRLTPLLLDHGVRLLGDLGTEIALEHAAVVQTPGATLIVYQVMRSA